MFNNFTFYEQPEPYEPPEEPRRNILRPIITVVVVLVLVVGSAYAALRPFLVSGDFSAILTAVAAKDEDCAATKQVNPVSALAPTRHVCVCGRLITLDANKRVTYHLRLKNADGKTLVYREIKSQLAGEFCQEMTLDRSLREGRYLVEISKGKNEKASAWFRFSVIDERESA